MYIFMFYVGIWFHESLQLCCAFSAQPSSIWAHVDHVPCTLNRSCFWAHMQQIASPWPSRVDSAKFQSFVDHTQTWLRVEGLHIVIADLHPAKPFFSSDLMQQSPIQRTRAQCFPVKLLSAVVDSCLNILDQLKSQRRVLTVFSGI